jgi:hypothetical protein
MGGVAERFVVALTATAELDERAPAEVELPTVLIEQLEISFDVNAGVVSDSHLCGHSGVLFRKSAELLQFS